MHLGPGACGRSADRPAPFPGRWGKWFARAPVGRVPRTDGGTTVTHASVRQVATWLAAAVLLPTTGLVAACSAGGASSTPMHTVTATTPPPATASPPPGGTPPGGTPTSSPPAPPPSSSPPAGPAECITADLRVGAAPGGAALGTTYYHVDFTNTAGAACVLQGYPGVSLVSADGDAGSQVGADAKRDASRPQSQVVLAPGQTANVLLGVADAGNFPAVTCHPVTAHWLKVFPPDQFTATYAMVTIQTCASTSVRTMHLTVIGAGA